METTKTRTSHQANSIRCGTVEIVQNGIDLLIRHHGKRQVVEVDIDAKTLEKWAVRQLRAMLF